MRELIPTSKKIRGEEHWLPAVKGAGSPVPIAWTKHDSEYQAKAEASRLLMAGQLEREALSAPPPSCQDSGKD